MNSQNESQENSVEDLGSLEETKIRIEETDPLIASGANQEVEKIRPVITETYEERNYGPG